MTTERLFEIAEKNNIEIMQTELPQTESCSLLADKTYYIGIDSTLTGIEERIHLAHELGHCLTGSMYNMYAPLDNRAKHELRADRWAFSKLLPPNKLSDALHQGYSTWDIAELYDLTPQFVHKALEYYQAKGIIKYSTDNNINF